MAKLAQPAPIAVPDPPAHLSERSRALWLALVPRRAASPSRIALLQTGLEALDRADAAREAIEREGMVLSSKAGGLSHVHPLLKIERDSRALLLRIWSDLGLVFDPDIDGRHR